MAIIIRRLEVAFLLLFLALVAACVSSFSLNTHQVLSSSPLSFQSSSSLILRLDAKKTTKQIKNRNKVSTSGFGGAAVVPCPCGSGEGYMKCCGKLHSDPSAYASATAEQVVRARYSAYAKREVDFIVGSTHPLNKNFISDIEHWKETIRMNCYDNFELNSCEILDETYEGEGDEQIAKVKFVAKMTQVDSREKTAFQETSTFERAGKNIMGGAWLYKEGVIETAPGMPEPKNLDEELKAEEEEGEQETSDKE
ncbi:hypothetical protein ACHAWC_006765 [Mediolabrus comicus]